MKRRPFFSAIPFIGSGLFLSSRDKYPVLRDMHDRMAKTVCSVRSWHRQFEDVFSHGYGMSGNFNARKRECVEAAGNLFGYSKVLHWNPVYGSDKYYGCVSLAYRESVVQCADLNNLKVWKSRQQREINMTLACRGDDHDPSGVSFSIWLDGSSQYNETVPIGEEFHRLWKTGEWREAESLIGKDVSIGKSKDALRVSFRGPAHFNPHSV
jgi:hypothetical protein